MHCIAAEEIFVDAKGEAQLRLRRDCILGAVLSSCGTLAKWQSPEEISLAKWQSPEAVSWPSVAFRVGLMLYCLGRRCSDPYPNKRTDLVLLDLKREVAGAGKPVRPDMQQYEGSQAFKEFMMKCLSTGFGSRPSYDMMKIFVLEMLGAERVENTYTF